MVILYKFYKTKFINVLCLFFFCLAMATTCKLDAKNWNNLRKLLTHGVILRISRLVRLACLTFYGPK